LNYGDGWTGCRRCCGHYPSVETAGKQFRLSLKTKDAKMAKRRLFGKIIDCTQSCAPGCN